QGDDDGADDEAEDHDHDRLEQADQGLDEDVDFLVVDVGNLVEHGVQVAGLLADIHHVDDHVVHEPAFFERLRDGFALADRFVNLLVHALEDGIHARLAHDRQRFQDGHAGAYQGAQGARGPGHHGLFDDVAHDRHEKFDAVQDVVAGLVEADELEGQPQGDGDQGQHIPVPDEPARGGDEGLGDPGQLDLEVGKDLLELGDDEDHDERQDRDGDEDDDDGVDHGPLDAAGQALGLFLEFGQAL